MAKTSKQNATGVGSSNQSRSFRERVSEGFKILKNQQEQVKRWENVDYDRVGNFKISRKH